jgi:long-chain acyl-CoA synthetase
MVVGQDQKYLAAIIIPWQQAIMDFAEESFIPIVDYELLLKQPETVELIAQEISRLVGPSTGFKSFERVYKFTLLPKSFEPGKELSGKNELLRHRITTLYAKEIHRLFREDRE